MESPGFSEVMGELLSLSFYALPIGLSLIAFVDAARWDSWVWALSGRRRVVWMAMIAFGVLSLPVGLVISSSYLLLVHRRLKAIDRGDLGDIEAPEAPDTPDTP